MWQKGAIPILLVLALVVGGLLLGAFYISQKTSFLSDALEGNSQSSLIYIPFRSPAPATATASASPVASDSAKTSIKPTESSKSASTSAQASSGAKLKFPGQPDAKIDVSATSGAKVKGISSPASIFEQIIQFLFK